MNIYGKRIRWWRDGDYGMGTRTAELSNERRKIENNVSLKVKLTVFLIHADVSRPRIRCMWVLLLCVRLEFW